jgi:catechol-2,3-dioxygenase
MTMDTIDPKQFKPEHTSPMRVDPPGTVQAMPRPQEMHHLHIYSDVNADAMVEFYQWLFNGEIIRKNPGGLTFISYDDHDHRVVIIPKKGWGTKPKQPVGVSHLAYAYASLGELMYIYKRMKEKGYKPVHCVNHGNSTSIYYSDPDGNTVETMMDNFKQGEVQDYKRYYQWSEPFGDMAEGNFDPDKMLEMYEAGVPDADLIDREKVRAWIKEGKL